MGLTQTSVALLTLLTFVACKDISAEEGDLVAVESRYKVVAKPEPYQPPRPAPDDFEITTRRGIDGAEIIYPTTTYRPVDLYLPTKGSEKFLLNFKKKNNNNNNSKNNNKNVLDDDEDNETEENLESLEIITKEKSASSSGKKRIKKVRKVLRNSAARSLSLSARNSTSNRFAEKEFSHHPEPRTEVKSLLPTIKPTHRPTTTTTTTTTTPRPHRQQHQHQQQHESNSKPAEEERLFQHSGDIDIRTNKKARGLAVLSQLSGRHHPLPPPPQPVIPAFLPAPANLPPRAVVPTASLAPLPTTANEIFGSSDILVDDTDYQFDADYETYKVRFITSNDSA
jgi:hypothetical protein